MSWQSLIADADLTLRYLGDGDNNGTGDGAPTTGSLTLTASGTVSYDTPPTGYAEGGKAMTTVTSGNWAGTAGSGVLPSGNATLCGWFKIESGATSNINLLTLNFGSPEFKLWRLNTNASKRIGSRYFEGGGTELNSGVDFTEGVWKHCALTISSAGVAYLYLDGTSYGPTDITSTSPTFDASTKRTLTLFSASTGYSAYDVRAYNRVLSSGEIGEIVDRPEPTYTSGATLSDVGAWNVGTWDAYSNGSETFSVLAAKADGTVVDEGSGETGTLDLSSAAGELVYLYVKAQNNGGFDVGDFATRTGDYGSANDTYYEVASVTAAGGGGGSALPAIAHHYRQLMCA